jgi:hypothetical protein
MESCRTCIHKDEDSSSDSCRDCYIDGITDHYESVNKTIKVKIVKCSESSYWYSNNIGEVYEVEEYMKKYYRIITGIKKGICIKKDDCITIEETVFINCEVLKVKPMSVNKPERIANFYKGNLGMGYSKLSDLPEIIKGKEEIMDHNKDHILVLSVVAIDKKNQKILIDKNLYFTENVSALEKTLKTELIRKYEKLDLNDLIIKLDIVITYEKEA